MSCETIENIMEAVLDGATSEIIPLIDKALEEKHSASEILKDGLIAGMNEVGALFKEGEMFVPEVLISAKTMQKGMERIKPLLVSGDIETVGKVITVTVEGDLHDIGIKLVGMMLEGAGFEVRNIGVDVPASAIVEAVKAETPDILAMSAMLTTTMGNMKEVVDLLKESGLDERLKVMIGGAPTTPDYAKKIGAFYGADASDAVKVAREIIKK